VATADWIADRGWVRPDHGGACFAGIPGTITQLLTGAAIAPPLPAATLAGLEQRYERVVLVYFDAFSFELATRHSGHPLLARAATDGVVSRLTTQFPSTTTAQMPTIHTGLPVGEHSLYEWFVLEPSLDRLIAPLPFAFAGDGQEPLTPHLRPETIYPTQTLYEWLGDREVRSAVAGPVGFGVSPTSTALLRGASAGVGFHDLDTGLRALAEQLTAWPGPAYGFAYIEDIDSLMHKVGPGNTAHTHLDDEIVRLLDTIERCLLDALPAGSLVIVTADHGMTPVSPWETTYLNVGSHAAELTAHLRCGAEPGGHPLAPAGSCRDLFLHALPGHVDDLVELLAGLLGPTAEVRRTRELLDDGIFGASPSPALRARLGDVVVLPALGDAVYWYTPGRFRQALWGQHGGLTPQEMEIPLIAVPAR
jgi:hypothetical protein